MSFWCARRPASAPKKRVAISREKMEITAGTKLGRYEIRSKIGAGGMGKTYLASGYGVGSNRGIKKEEAWH